jgi:hypothetical protein
MALDHDVSDAVLGKSNRGRQSDWSGTTTTTSVSNMGALPAFMHRFKRPRSASGSVAILLLV